MSPARVFLYKTGPSEGLQQLQRAVMFPVSHENTAKCQHLGLIENPILIYLTSFSLESV